MRFSKPPLTVQAQIDLLISRGLVISDGEQAHYDLTHLNYYRLSAYWLPFESDHESHQFHENTRFESILNVYEFDQALRLLLMKAIECIEVSVRSTWAYQMAHRYEDAHFHLRRDLFKRRWNYEGNCRSVEKEILRSNEAFIIHLREKYDESLPPIWAMVEVMTFGQLSNWYGNTLLRQDRQSVSIQYGLDETILTSFLHHLTVVRNTCAHHARLWNREFPVTSKLPSRESASLSTSDERKIYNTLTLLIYLMQRISPRGSWRNSLINLIEQYDIDTSVMGFPLDWKIRPLWCN